jgi:hypothetical protein
MERRAGPATCVACETTATGPASEASGLPFTGSDVLVLAGIGWLLLLAASRGVASAAPAAAERRRRFGAPLPLSLSLPAASSLGGNGAKT